MMVLALAALGPVSSVGAQGVHVALVPSSASVAPGSEFDVVLQVTQAGSAFNAFDAVVQYDPGALTLVSLSPLSLQEGAMMTNACPNTFHDFRRGVDRDTIADVLLCDGVSVSGPGPLYRLHFRASSTPQGTTLRILPGLKFYAGGIAVGPVVSSNVSIGIGVTLDVQDPPSQGLGLRVRAAPNPMRAGTTLFVESDREGLQDLVICDLLGRVARRLEHGNFRAGTRGVHWDGRDDAGNPVRPGVYLVRVEIQGRRASQVLALIR